MYEDSGVLTLPFATNQAWIFNDSEIIQKLPQISGARETVDFIYLFFLQVRWAVHGVVTTSS